jgi:hypothetical protein
MNQISALSNCVEYDDACVCFIRLSPPFSIAYGDSWYESPLIYVGSGDFKTRWKSHRNWLAQLGHSLPSGRYEIWFCRPTRKGPKAGKFYKDVEADVLQWFRDHTEHLPFWNKKVEKPKNKNEYDKNFFASVSGSDSRYHWVMYPRTTTLKKIYEKGVESIGPQNR